MKVKTSNLMIKIMIFLFVVFAFLVVSTKISAASTDLYYPNKLLANGYNENGEAILDQNIIVYAHNNGAGYQLDGKKLRVAKLTVTIGSITKEYIAEGNNHAPNVSITNGESNLGENGYGGSKNINSSLVDKITISIKNILDSGDFSSVKYINEVIISLQLEQRKYFIVPIGWQDYKTSVNTYKGDIELSDQHVSYVKTNVDFFTSRLTVTGMNISIIDSSGNTVSNKNGDLINYYNRNHYDNNYKLKIQLATNFKFNGGIRLHSGNEQLLSIRFSNSNQGEIVLDRNQILYYFTIDNGHVYDIDKFILIAYSNDIYMSGISNEIEVSSTVSGEFVLDTIAPSIIEAGLEVQGDNHYDIVEIQPWFKVNENVQIEINEIVFSVGGRVTYCRDFSMVNTNDAPGGVLVESDGKIKIQVSCNISGNGIIKMTKYAAVLIDNYGNSTEYVNATSNIIESNDIVLESSVNNVSVEKKYYYQGETIYFVAELKNTSQPDEFDSVILNFSDNSTYAFTSHSRVGNFVTYQYQVGEKNTTISSIVFKKRNGNEIQEVYVNYLYLHLNEYLYLNDLYVVSPTNDRFNIYLSSYGEIVNFKDELVYFSIIDDVINSKECRVSTDKLSVLCSYVSKKDGIDTVVIDKNAIVLANGLRNARTTFNLSVDKNAPVVSVELDSDKIIAYDSKTYFKDGEDIVSFILSDGYASRLCLHYKINDDEYSRMCLEDDHVQFKISLPQERGEYRVTYYVSDGVNNSNEFSISNIFEYRDEFEMADITLEVNGIEINQNTTNLDEEKKFNYINVHYTGAGASDLLDSVNVSLNLGATDISQSSKELSKTFSLELPSIDDSITIVVQFVDKLGNSKEFDISVNVDTILPSFENVMAQVSENDTLYTVLVSGYLDNTIEVEINGENVVLNNDTFITDSEKFTIYLKDSAGNVNSKVFTTISPYVELFKLEDSIYEINVSPFDSSIHQIEDYRYLVFEYLSNISDNVISQANANVCTPGRKVNCYIEGSFTATSGQIVQSFNSGYSYILLVKVSGVLVNAKDSDALPRLDVTPQDTISPSGEYLDEDINPDYISSISGNEFTFSFLANDTNLADNYYYLVVDSNMIMDINKFYDLYKSCYGAISSTNSCGFKGENNYIEEVENRDNTYLGEVTIISTDTIKKRLINNNTYSLYVLLRDLASNETLFKVRDFINISESSEVEYYDDTNNYVKIENGEQVSTINTTKIRITRYNQIGILSLKIDGNSKACDSINGCEFELGVGKHQIEVVDVLGNVSEVIIYSGVANNPIIQIEYEYEGMYYNISNSDLAYNTNNANKVYLKVIGSDLSGIRVTMNNTSIYQDGDSLFNLISDEDSEHGVNLETIMNIHNESAYSGSISIIAFNSSGGETSVTLNIDNQAPLITLLEPGRDVNILGRQYKLEVQEGKYKLAFNYQNDITYAYLMDILSVEVDGVKLTSMLDIDRLKVMLDGNKLVNFDDSISKGNKEITIDYFDNAGNVAIQKVIVISVFDDEDPTMILNNALTIAELNVSSKLANVIVSDNCDSEITLKVSINGDEIDYTNYKFLSVGEFEVVYLASDSENNQTTITQKIIVKDTIAPQLKPNTITSYTVGVDEELEISMPKFIDTDPNSSEFAPYQIEVLNAYNNVINSTLVGYPLVIDGDKIKIRFGSDFNYELGNYKIVFYAKDSENNANEGIINLVLIDESEPLLNVLVNNKEIKDGSVNIFPWGGSVNISTTAFDDYDGDLTSRIIKTIKFNNKIVDTIDTNINGDYIVEFRVKDNSNNEKIVTIIIKIEKDEISPSIDSVIINGIELKDDEDNYFKDSILNIVVEASDNSNYVDSEIVINNEYKISSGQDIHLENGLSNEVYNIVVNVVDSSGNEYSKTYIIMIDNKLPDISGFTDNYVYTSSVNLNAYDDNISIVEIYKNNILYTTLNGNLIDYKIEQEGIYRIVAIDSYGNEVSTNFSIIGDSKYNIIDENNETSTLKFDNSFFIETKIENNVTTFILSDNGNISKYDDVYILVCYPNSNYKYLVYSMDGETYLSNSSISLDNQIIEGVNNGDLLQQIGDKYYSYVVVVKTANTNEGVNDQKDINNETVGKIIMTILAVLSVLAIVIIIVRLRRRIRAA